MGDFLTVLANYGMEIVATVVTTIVTGVLLPKAANFLKAKTESRVWQNIVNDLVQTCGTSVALVEQTFVKQLKEDGQWNTETQKVALSMAVKEAYINITSATRNSLLSQQEDITDMITRYVEAAVLNMHAK